MIDYENIRRIVCKGLKEYCQCPVIRSNQNEAPPPYNYLSYTVTTLKGENKGTYGVYEDGAERKPFSHIWSVTAVSDNDSDAVELACKAHEWFDRVGKTYFDDNGIILVSVGSVTPRDNILTVEYEYKKGFDVFFSVFDTVEGMAEQDGVIEAAEIGGISAEMPPTVDELNEKLAKRLDGEVV